MINVLSVVSELNFGGGENRIFNFARSIDASRFRHTVVTLYSSDDARSNRCGSMRQQFADAGVKVLDLGLPHPSTAKGSRLARLANTAGTLARAVGSLRELIVSNQVDLVDAHLETALYTAVPAASRLGVPSVVTLYSPVEYWKVLDGDTYRKTIFPAIRRINLRLTNAIVTDSKAGAQELAEFIGEDPPPIHVFPNGVRLDEPTRARAEVLKDFEIPPDTRSTLIGQVAGLVPYKGQAVLLDAARRVLDLGHDVFVLCVGDERGGPEFPLQLRRQAEALGIANRVRIKAYPGNIADVWNVIDVHVHPSSIDSLPNAVLEGMSVGKPAVLSSVGGIPDHVDDGRTGLIVPPGDVRAVAHALIRLLRDPAFAARLGRAARERYLERFTPEVTTRQLEQCFESTIESHRRAAPQQGAKEA